MPNYSLVMNPYQARSFEDMIKPYLMLTEAYLKQEGAYDTIEAAADMLDRFINKENDPTTRALYDNFMTDLSTLSAALSKYGLNEGSKRNLRKLKSRYNKDITAILNAVTLKQKLVQALQTLMALDDSIMPERDILRPGYESSLDRWMEDPAYTYGKVFSPRKQQEAMYKATSRRQAQLKEATSWTLKQEYDYIHGRIPEMHPVAIEYFNRLYQVKRVTDPAQKMKVWQEAQNYLLENYLQLGEAAGTVDYTSGYYPDYDQTNSYATGGPLGLVDTNRIPRFASAVIDDLTTGYSGAKKATTPSKGSSGRSSKSSGTTGVPSGDYAAHLNLEKAKTEKTGSKDTEAKSSKKSEDTDGPLINGFRVNHELINSPNIEGIDRIKALRWLSQLLGFDPDNNFKYDMKRGRGYLSAPDADDYKWGPKSKYSDPYVFKWFGKSEHTPPGRVAFITKDSVLSLRERHWYNPSTWNWAALILDNMPKGILTGEWFLGDNPDSLQVPKGATDLDEIYDRVYDIITKYIPADLTFTDGTRGWSPEGILDYLINALNKSGAYGLSFWEIAFTADEEPWVFNKLFSSGPKAKGKTGFRKIKSWDKDGNPQLGDREPRSTFYDHQDKGDVLKSTPTIYANGNPNMRGIIIDFDGEYYFLKLEDSKSLVVDALNAVDDVERANKDKEDYKKAIEAALKEANPNISDEDFKKALDYELSQDTEYKRLSGLYDLGVAAYQTKMYNALYYPTKVDPLRVKTGEVGAYQGQ